MAPGQRDVQTGRPDARQDLTELFALVPLPQSKADEGQTKENLSTEDELVADIARPIEPAHEEDKGEDDQGGSGHGEEAGSDAILEVGLRLYGRWARRRGSRRRGRRDVGNFKGRRRSGNHGWRRRTRHRLTGKVPLFVFVETRDKAQPPLERAHARFDVAESVLEPL